MRYKISVKEGILFRLAKYLCTSITCYFSISILLTGNLIDCQAESPFIFRNRSHSYVCEKIITSDSSIILGFHICNGMVKIGFNITKISNFNHIEWSKDFYLNQTTNHYFFYNLCNTKDKGLIVTGTTTAFSSYTSDHCFLLKLDSSGNKMWEKSYFSYDNYGLVSNYCTELKNGNIQCWGAMNTAIFYNDTTNQQLFCLNVDSAGTVINSTVYNANFLNPLNNFYRTINIYNSELILGMQNELNKFTLVRIDTSGNIKKSRDEFPIGLSLYKIEYSDKDSSFILIGDYYTYPNTQGDIFIAKIDINGNTKWNYRYTGHGYEHYVQSKLLKSGNTLVMGITSSSSSNYTESALIFCISKDGELLWTRKYLEQGLIPPAFAASINAFELEDSIKILAAMAPGIFKPADYGFFDIDTLGESNCLNRNFSFYKYPTAQQTSSLQVMISPIQVISEPTLFRTADCRWETEENCLRYTIEEVVIDNIKFKVYPSVFSEYVTIEKNSKLDFRYNLKIFDSKGSLIRSIFDCTESQVLNLSLLLSGVYFLSLETDTSKEILKITKIN